MSFLSVLQGIAQGAEKGIEAAAKVGVALAPEITAINPVAGMIAGAVGQAIVGAEATKDPGPQKKETAMSGIMLGMTLAFELEGKQLPADVQAQLSTGIDALIQAINSLNAIGASVQATASATTTK